MQSYEHILNLIIHTDCTIMGNRVDIIIARDKKDPINGRIYIQCSYQAPNTCKRNEPIESFKGRKWYLSDHMTDDEVIKTCYMAFKAAVEHEIMEGFRFMDQRVFNPHTPFTVLMEASTKQQFREQNP